MAGNMKPTAKETHETLIIKSAIFSRLLLLTLIVLWRSLVSPYDTSASINPTCLATARNRSSSPPHPPLFPSLGSAIENGVVWDSVYFVRIAQCGYEYEQTYAFLPLLPICISILSRTVFAPLIPVIGYRAVLALAGYFVNNVAFVLAAVYFYRLSVNILEDPETAFRASVLFCFNPASIFYSSIYSESLYALFSIGGMYHLISGANNTAVLWFALSGLARSNGVLNAGYFCFQTMHWAYEALFLKKRVSVLITGAFRCLCICIPFVAFQAYGYYNICLGRCLDELRPWCRARIPLLYNFIQSHYWGVGFLRYFQLKQLPNFLLASPILSLSVWSIVHYVKSRTELSLSLGFQLSSEEKNSAAWLYSLETVPKSKDGHILEKPSSVVLEKHDLRQRKQTSKAGDPAELHVEYESPAKSGYLSPSILPFVIHLGIMVATAFFVMHVQVATRFLSSSPPLYWFASYLMVSPGMGKRRGYMIWTYCAAYILLGSLLFSNFYPFT
ncbi:GPI mannosyltransferase 2 isoform X2 [Carica papaya]|uniref:GPI mannosyltransferase 2 isoform X2 n=1 Tax=Carica papaya TaxID=3649 RepID=UPI000B8C717C|nr:GPI mannosyltransferase 2 isoform X2 [Carica papaya]